MSPRGRRRKRRVIVLGLGVGATITVIVVLALLKEMVVRYHLGNVQGDLDYFGELLETSDEFAVREALERYVVTLEGSKALVHQCLEQGLRSGLEQWLDQAEKTRSRALMHSRRESSSR